MTFEEAERAYVTALREGGTEAIEAASKAYNEAFKLRVQSYYPEADTGPTLVVRTYAEQLQDHLNEQYPAIMRSWNETCLDDFKVIGTLIVSVTSKEMILSAFGTVDGSNLRSTLATADRVVEKAMLEARLAYLNGEEE